MTTTSGNPTADRRFDMAMQLRVRGDTDAAIDLIRQTLELVPAWPEGRFVLAELFMETGAVVQAVSEFQAYLLLDHSDSMGAGAKLVTLGARTPTNELADAYIARLFDQYAPTFDHALVEGLRYSAPRQIREALDAAHPVRSFESALDLGCGTGLMGAAIRDKAHHLHGVDISAGMLAEAKTKGIYDTLQHRSLLDALEGTNTFDLILAADVLVYVGDLVPVLRAARRALRPTGVLAFTLQKAAEDFRLGPDQRFSHSPIYVADILRQLGYGAIDIKERSFRQEKKVDVPGLLVVSERD
jgi:predicted TPR repeat methyltransferase